MQTPTPPRIALHGDERIILRGLKKATAALARFAKLSRRRRRRRFEEDLEELRDLLAIEEDEVADGPVDYSLGNHAVNNGPFLEWQGRFYPETLLRRFPTGRLAELVAGRPLSIELSSGRKADALLPVEALEALADEFDAIALAYGSAGELAAERLAMLTARHLRGLVLGPHDA